MCSYTQGEEGKCCTEFFLKERKPWKECVEILEESNGKWFYIELLHEASLSKDATESDLYLTKASKMLSSKPTDQRLHLHRKIEQNGIFWPRINTLAWLISFSHTLSPSLCLHKRQSLSKLLIRNNPGPYCACASSKHYMDTHPLPLPKTMPGSMLEVKCTQDSALICALPLSSPHMLIWP